MIKEYQPDDIIQDVSFNEKLNDVMSLQLYNFSVYKNTMDNKIENLLGQIHDNKKNIDIQIAKIDETQNKINQLIEYIKLPWYKKIFKKLKL